MTNENVHYWRAQRISCQTFQTNNSQFYVGKKCRLYTYVGTPLYSLGQTCLYYSNKWSRKEPNQRKPYPEIPNVHACVWMHGENSI
jgi:hypothetical protein